MIGRLGRDRVDRRSVPCSTGAVFVASIRRRVPAGLGSTGTPCADNVIAILKLVTSRAPGLWY